MIDHVVLFACFKFVIGVPITKRREDDVLNAFNRRCERDNSGGDPTPVTKPCEARLGPRRRRAGQRCSSRAYNSSRSSFTVNEPKVLVSPRLTSWARPNVDAFKPGTFAPPLLGLYDRDRMTMCPPELFLMPAWSPLAADRLYCHTRYIYLGMAYLSGVGLCANLGR